MNDMFRLYIGLVIEGEWYNHAKVEELKGGMISLLDTADKTATARLKVLVQQTVKKLYTDPANGEVKEYELQNSHYDAMKMEDAWKIAFEVHKNFTGEEHPKIEEYFFCPVCSIKGRERYTTTNDSWQELIDLGLIDEIYSDTPECKEIVVLPHGFEIADNKLVTPGVYNSLIVEPITIGELQKIVNNSFIVDNEALLLCAIWDTKIKEVDGLTKKDLNILKRNNRDPFTKKYFLHKDDIEEMTNVTSYGLNADYRTVSCKYCHSEIGGGLDFTNFFDFLFPRQSNRGLIRGKAV